MSAAKFKWKRAIDWCNGEIIHPELSEPGPCCAQEGELHRLGCPYERCTQCGDQFLYCDCPEPFEERKRVPYFRVWGHQHCARCDRPWPEFFAVADEAWQFYVLSLGHGDMMLCVDCFNLIAELTDGGACLRRYGVPIMFDDPDYMRVVNKRNELTRMRRQQPDASAAAQLCHDCGVDTSFSTGIGHYYNLRNEVWRQATRNCTAAQFLCLNCLETRLDRPLTEADFIATPPEIMARFAGQAGEPLPAAERQHQLDEWRTYTRCGGTS
jgi:hypothetical protein